MRGNLILNSKEYLLRTSLTLLDSSHLGSTPSVLKYMLFSTSTWSAWCTLTNNFKILTFQINATKYFGSTSHDRSSNIYLKSLSIYVVFYVLIDNES